MALGTVRVMRTTGMMGEVVGMPASICKKKSTTPRGVYREHLDKLKTLMRKGIGAPPPLPPAFTPPKPPVWLARAGESLARSARVAVSGHYNPTQYPASNINDGRYNVQDKSLIDWDATFPPITCSRLRVVVYDTPGGLTRIWELEVYNLRQDESQSNIK